MEKLAVELHILMVYLTRRLHQLHTKNDLEAKALLDTNNTLFTSLYCPWT